MDNYSQFLFLYFANLNLVDWISMMLEQFGARLFHEEL